MAENHVLLETINLTQSASSVTFDNIPQTGYTDLKLVISSRTNTITGAWDNCYVQFNGTSSGYSQRILYGNGVSGLSDSGSSSNIRTVYSNTASQGSNYFSSNELYIPNYTSSAYKLASMETAVEQNGQGAHISLATALWENTSAITSITLSPSNYTFASGCTFSLYGLAATGTTPATAPFAIGGNIVANDGTYWYHAFTSSGKFIPLKSLSCDVLIVGGGGSGGADVGGGAGAGRVYAPSTTSFVSSTQYACTIGAGGTPGINVTNYQAGRKGTDSSIIGGAVSYTALGGGGGNSRQGSTATANDGWNGGGGSYDATRPYTSGNGGNAGGAVVNPGSNPTYAGGGGGAGEAGNTDGTGQGGDGVSTYSAWHTATLTGVSNGSTLLIGGGGGGGMYGSSTSNAVGGDGGGGLGGDNDQGGGDGVANSGAGGGGAGSSQPGGAGGSGLIIIRYSMV